MSDSLFDPHPLKGVKFAKKGFYLDLQKLSVKIPENFDKNTPYKVAR